MQTKGGWVPNTMTGHKSGENFSIIGYSLMHKKRILNGFKNY